MKFSSSAFSRAKTTTQIAKTQYKIALKIAYVNEPLSAIKLSYKFFMKNIVRV
jgi:hypothetical protein